MARRRGLYYFLANLILSLRAGVDFDLESRHMIDVQNIFHKMEQRTLRAAYQFYCGKTLEGAHEALPDTEATLEVLMAQLERYADAVVMISDTETVGPVPLDMGELADFCQRQPFADPAGRFVYDAEGAVQFNFGQHKGKNVSDVLKENPGYFGWMMGADFPAYTKKVLQRVHDEMNR